MPSERRLAAFAALGLFASLFLPWYQETVIPTSAGGAKTPLPSASLTGWAAFSFVEAAVLLVAVGVVVLLFLRAEGRAFHVPGGDGGVITAAGLWTSVLIVWRMFDKQSTSGHGQYVTTSGIEWGIFIALGVAVLLAYAGTRIRLAHDPEPPLPGDSPDAGPAPTRRPRAQRRQAVQSRNRERPAPARGGPSRADERPAPVRGGPSRADERPAPVRGGPSRADERPAPVRGDPSRADERPAPPPRPRVMEEPASWSYEEMRASHRSLNFSELHEIELDDPPEPPTVRRRTRIEDYDPTEAPTTAEPDPDDQLTIRFDPE
jgi:hypothetical protein